MLNKTITYTPAPQPVTINGETYQLVAFYFPGQNTPWDDIYNAPFFGNFWESPVTITPPGLPSGSFHTAEAAFQATKWWQNENIRQQFETALTGDDAFHIRNHAGPQTNHNWAGFGRIGAMEAVLQSKFQDSKLAAALSETGDAYLLEHSSSSHREGFWSDKCDGSGENQLGLALMRLRSQLLNNPIPSYPAMADFTQNVQGATPCQ